VKIIKPILVLLVLVGVYALATQGPKNASAGASATPQPDLKIGSEFVGAGWRYSVKQADLSDKIQYTEFGIVNTYNPKGVFVIVALQLTNLTTEGSATLRESDFELREVGGARYSPTRLIGLPPEPGYVRLGEAFPPTVALMTKLIFDVTPPGTGGMLLHLIRPNSDIRLD
jgi:hypothetical protein